MGRHALVEYAEREDASKQQAFTVCLDVLSFAAARAVERSLLRRKEYREVAMKIQAYLKLELLTFGHSCRGRPEVKLGVGNSTPKYEFSIFLKVLEKSKKLGII